MWKTSTPIRLMSILIIVGVSGCGLIQTKSSINDSFAAITNAASYDCKSSDGQPVPGCVIEGKLILTAPTQNITYILYRPEDNLKTQPIPCTLPAQAAEALATSSSIGLSVPVKVATGSAALSGTASESQTAQLISLGNNVAPALYVLTSNFSLCLAYGFGVLSAAEYATQLETAIEAAKSLGTAPPSTPPATPTPPPAPNGHGAAAAAPTGAVVHSN